MDHSLSCARSRAPYTSYPISSEKAGALKGPFGTKLDKDTAFEIDNLDILKHLEIESGKFVKGFVLIDSPEELDVVAVYTAAGPTSQIQTMFLERVPYRKTAD